MYNYSYDEYMNNLLGYSNQIKQNIYENKTYEEQSMFTYNQLEECYPDIYKIVYPMVCKVCMNINENITEDLINRLTNEIYAIIENDEIEEETKSATMRVNYSNIRNNRNLKQVSRNEHITTIPKQEKRNKNFLLNDIIKILILRELLGNGRRRQ